MHFFFCSPFVTNSLMRCLLTAIRSDRHFHRNYEILTNRKNLFTVIVNSMSLRRQMSC